MKIMTVTAESRDYKIGAAFAFRMRRAPHAARVLSRKRGADGRAQLIAEPQALPGYGLRPARCERKNSPAGGVHQPFIDTAVAAGRPAPPRWFHVNHRRPARKPSEHDHQSHNSLRRSDSPMRAHRTEELRRKSHGKYWETSGSDTPETACRRRRLVNRLRRVKSPIAECLQASVHGRSQFRQARPTRQKAAAANRTRFTAAAAFSRLELAECREVYVRSLSRKPSSLRARTGC